MRYPIPGFPAYAVVQRDGDWVIRNVAKGFDLEGCARPNRRPRFKLKDPDGRATNLSIDGWLLRAGVLTTPPTPAVALSIPGFSRYQLARRPNGRWAIRATAGSVRWRGHWLSYDRQVCLVADDGTSVVRQFTHLILAAHGQPRPSERHYVSVDPTVDPVDWPKGLSWRAPAMAGTPAA